MSVVDGPGLHGLKAWLKVWVMCSYDLETDYLIPIKLFFSSINQEQISKYSWSILTSPFPSHHSFLLSFLPSFIFSFPLNLHYLHSHYWRVFFPQGIMIPFFPVFLTIQQNQDFVMLQLRPLCNTTKLWFYNIASFVNQLKWTIKVWFCFTLCNRIILLLHMLNLVPPLL